MSATITRQLRSMAWTLDTYDSPCPGCGGAVRWRRRGPIALLPSAHGPCRAHEWQADVLRTVKAEESAGICVTSVEVARRLRCSFDAARRARGGTP